MGKSLIDSNNFGAARVRRAEKNAGHRAKPTWCRRENPQKGTMNEKDRIEEYRTKIASGELKPAEAQRELAGWLGCTPVEATRKLSGKNARRGTRRF